MSKDSALALVVEALRRGIRGHIYTDTDYGNGYTSKTAMVAISAGTPPSRVLWEP